MGGGEEQRWWTGRRGLPSDQTRGLTARAASAAGVERLIGPVVLFVHYPPLPLDSAWLARGMLITNGVALHELLVSLRPRVPVAFFGHIHRGVHVIRDGILYSSVSSTSCPFTCWPDDTRIRFDPMHAPGFHYVSVEVPAANANDATVIVKAHLARVAGRPKANREAGGSR